MAKSSARLAARVRRHARIRKKVVGTGSRPRLSVFRSAKHIYAQLIDDVAGVTLASASTLTAAGKEDGKALGNVEGARLVGRAVAEAAMKVGIESVVFDRSGYIYHGRVQALAEAAREAGLKF